MWMRPHVLLRPPQHMWAPVSAGGRGLLSLRGPLGQAWSRAPPAGHSGTAGGHAGGSAPVHGATPASFQAPAVPCYLRKRLIQKEPNTRFPQKYLRRRNWSPKTRNEMWTRLLPRPVKLTQPSSTVGGTAGWLVQLPWKQCGGSSGVTNRASLRPAGEWPELTPKIQMQ